jgi:hypothetical protein
MGIRVRPGERFSKDVEPGQNFAVIVIFGSFVIGLNESVDLNSVKTSTGEMEKKRRGNGEKDF